nr:PREDICTED: protocadherin gamma-A4 isoform X8 [Latimeria chalumnae]|eukprot:XP_014343524.1 PREDICTED: protocadherin gamma-A4 isoform X8 [Latimeria chalumnae]
MKEWQAAGTILLVFLNVYLITGQNHYSIPEEKEHGFLVGNIAKDIGLNISNLSDRKLSVIFGSKKQYFEVNLETGHLYVNERIDREEICGENPLCLLDFEIVVENPLNLYPTEVEIQDINDNPPAFAKNQQQIEILESTLPGARFPLDYAQDPDVGLNSLQKYYLSPNQNFKLHMQTGSDGGKYVELVLEKPLDRENQKDYLLTLTAVDGGVPARSGTVQIHIIILDVNDNVPAFPQSVYEVSMKENTKLGTLVLKLNATDNDEGSNGEITYSFSRISHSARKLFNLDPVTGEIRVIEVLDFEETEAYQMDVEAKDGGGLTVRCKVLIEILDENDNVPEVTITSRSNSIPEDCSLGTVIALLKVHDLDSGNNGKIECFIFEDSPFLLTSSFQNYYKLIINRALDREQISEYNITIVAKDKGLPPHSTIKVLHLQITDVNDNPPVFQKTPYMVYVMENNPSGFSIFAVQASDPDWNQNARVTYSIIESRIHGIPLSSYISINSENGQIYALGSFDYEKFREFEIHVKAQDGGSPSLSSNVTVKIFILDQNDNVPEILYPSLTDSSAIIELVPRSSEAGYLVTKVVAVDADSGQNAWLSYRFLKVTESGLFQIGLHTGEIRTSRPFRDTDVIKQTLLILVKDNGLQALSVTVTLNVLLAESFNEVLSDMRSLTDDSVYNANLRLYLIISLVLVSFVFILTITIILILKVRRARNARLFESAVTNHPTMSTLRFPPLYNEKSFIQTYPYEFILQTDPESSEFKFFQPHIQNTLKKLDVASNSETLISGHEVLEGGASPKLPEKQIPPNTDWRFSQGQRPGTSGSQPPTDEIAAWPSNQMDSERLQNMMAAAAAANEPSDGGSTMGAGTLGLSTRYGPQFTLQHVPDYRQNVYIPGSMSSLSNAGQQGGKKKKSGKKDKK